MMRPSPGQLFGEAARIAYYLHWPLDTILDLEHRDRMSFLEECAHLTHESNGSR